MIARLLARWLRLPWWARLLLVLPGLVLLAAVLPRREQRGQLVRLAREWGAEADAAADTLDAEAAADAAAQAVVDAGVEEAGRKARTGVEPTDMGGEGPYLDDGRW